MLRTSTQRKSLTRLKQTSLVSLSALIVVLTLSGCWTSGYELSTQVRIDPTADFLRCISEEYTERRYGECTEQMLNDWLVQNAPDAALD